MDNNYVPPNFLQMMKLLLPFTLTWESKPYTIDELQKKAVKECKENRRQDKITIFNRFTSALLEGFRTKGKDYGQRIELMNKHVKNFSDITESNVHTILRENKYSLKTRAIEIITDTKQIVEPASFQWEQYFLKAESEYERGYTDDIFLKIKGVGNKVRDFALSEFSLCFCAIDRHVADVIRRTGLLLHGYGQEDFGTSPSENYDFLQRLIIHFARDSGWSLSSGKGYSPKEIDATFWFLGQEKGICKNKPECYHCPISKICLTYLNWKGTPIKPPSELRMQRQEEQRLIRQWIKEHPEEAEELRKKSGF